MGRAAGWLCLLLGVGCLFAAGGDRLAARAWQAEQAARWDRTPPGPPGVAPRHGEALGRLSVPSLGLDVVVAEGNDAATLRRGPGHLEGSALPGEEGNCVIAGHRDGPFRALRRIRRGDRIELRSARGVSLYDVLSVRVVDRDDTTPLAPEPRPVLTLVTCYPFDFIGPAPRRFIVRAGAHEAAARPSSPSPPAGRACGA